jgi:thioredoxin-dependent peroxiredoxin
MATQAEMSKMLKEGDRAPSFKVTADDGEKVSSADYRGKNLVLFFYPKANTPG